MACGGDRNRSPLVLGRMVTGVVPSVLFRCCLPRVFFVGRYMPRFLYTLLLYALLPLIVLRQWWRGRGQAVAIGSLAARFGFVPATPAGAPSPVWLHCVSVGETVAAEPLIEALLASGETLLVTSTTYTGAARVQARFGARVRHCFMPYDTPVAVARFLARIRPCQLVILETELWPNLLHACSRRGIPALLVNARLSARSARGYARTGALARNMLAALAAVSTQTRADAARFLALGVSPARVHVNGNLKFDVAVDPLAAARAAALRAEFGARPVWIATSTHAGEDEIVLAAHRAICRNFPEALLVLVPRHPERFDDVAELIVRSGFACARRARGELPSARTTVYLGDTMGELPLLYGLADVAFVGGSLVPVGGHNLVEPAALGLPLLAGPHLFNFQQIADDLRAAGALDITADAEALVVKVTNLFGSDSARTAAGRKGRDYVAANRGACERTLALTHTLRASSLPSI